MSNAPIIHRIFSAGMWLKACDGLLEIIGGLLLLLISPLALHRAVQLATQHELAEDARDLVANLLRRAAGQLSASTQLFGSVYLIAHGLIKVAVALAVLRGHRWAYPAAIGFLGLFILYQIYRLSYDFSAGLLLLTLFDALMVLLTWLEYRRVRAAASSPAAQEPQP